MPLPLVTVKGWLDRYRQVLLDSGMEADEDIIFINTIVRETGYSQGKIAIEKGCDAIYGAGDFSALGVVDAAKGKGLRIPEDFGIVGTANEDFTELMSPALSSLSLKPYEMGKAAAEESGTHLYPFRTEKLNALTPMVLTDQLGE